MALKSLIKNHYIKSIGSKIKKLGAKYTELSKPIKYFKKNAITDIGMIDNVMVGITDSHYTGNTTFTHFKRAVVGSAVGAGLGYQLGKNKKFKKKAKR